MIDNVRYVFRDISLLLILIANILCCSCREIIFMLSNTHQKEKFFSFSTYISRYNNIQNICDAIFKYIKIQWLKWKIRSWNAILSYSCEINLLSTIYMDSRNFCICNSPLSLSLSLGILIGKYIISVHNAFARISNRQINWRICFVCAGD